MIDDALAEIESENPRLKSIPDKRFARTQLEPGTLGALIDLISTVGFTGNGQKAVDVLGQVYEYFLGQFASAEGKKGGQFYTPASVVRVLVDVLAPHKGKVYDPAAVRAECSCNPKSSSKVTAGASATFLFMGRRATRPRGGWWR